MSEIDLSNKTDREILVLLVSKTNDIVEGLRIQNGRVRKLEDWKNEARGWKNAMFVVLPIVSAIISGVIVKSI